MRKCGDDDGELVHLPGLRIGEGDGKDVIAAENGRRIEFSDKPGCGLLQTDNALVTIDFVAQLNALVRLIRAGENELQCPTLG